MHRMRSENVSSRRRLHTKNKLKNLEEVKKKDQKVVDCLYFGLMCCDVPCSILWAKAPINFSTTSSLRNPFDSYLFSNAISELRIKNLKKKLRSIHSSANSQQIRVYLLQQLSSNNFHIYFRILRPIIYTF